MTKPNSCSLYVFLVQRLLENRKNHYSMEITRDEIKDIFSNKCKLPAYLHWNILKDMETFELIKIINKFKIEILHNYIDDGLEGIDEIQKMADTMTQKEIGKEIGINQQRVSEILKEKKELGYFD